MSDEDAFISNLQLLNFQTWPENLKELSANDETEEVIGSLATWFNMENYIDMLQKEWKDLVQMIATDEEYFLSLKTLNPSSFWEAIMSHYRLNEVVLRFVT